MYDWDWDWAKRPRKATVLAGPAIIGIVKLCPIYGARSREKQLVLPSATSFVEGLALEPS